MIAITNAKVVLEHGILFDGVVLVKDEKIIAVGKADEISIPDDAQICDANGRYVGPGFVDIHVHGGNGYMTCENPEPSAEHFLKHGETTILATFYYQLTKQGFLDCIERVRNAMKKDGPGKAIAGFYMEGPYMNPKYGASPEQNKWRGEIKADDYMDVVKEAGELTKVWAIAPERDGIEGFMRDAKSVNPDVSFAIGHSEATPQQIRKLKKYGINLMTHCMNATGRPPVSAGTRSCGPDEACLMDSDIYAELICDSQGTHVPSDLMRLVIQTKGMDKVVLITDSFVSDAPTPERFKHIEDLNFDDNGGLCGSKLTMDIVCRNLMMHTNCGIAQAFLMASTNPARAIGMDEEIGSIEVGKKANLVIVDDIFNIEKVMLQGKFY